VARGEHEHRRVRHVAVRVVNKPGKVDDVFQTEFGRERLHLFADRTTSGEDAAGIGSSLDDVGERAQPCLEVFCLGEAADRQDDLVFVGLQPRMVDGLSGASADVGHVNWIVHDRHLRAGERRSRWRRCRRHHWRRRAPRQHTGLFGPRLGW